ncbi:uncharacterized protein LOC143181494 [Calliopsis andreniformis]|uniref:uncharacterized protein LOC143181494 n=1 Tax=Calliopsis andreniformis TaxID=337506 RepID=UPI003FCDEA49
MVLLSCVSQVLVKISARGELRTRQQFSKRFVLDVTLDFVHAGTTGLDCVPRSISHCPLFALVTPNLSIIGPRLAVKYVCKPCGKTYKWKKNLVRHERQECGKQPHRCDFCNRVMNLKDSLIRHLREKHGQDVRVGRRVPQEVDPLSLDNFFVDPVDNESD